MEKFLKLFLSLSLDQRRAFLAFLELGWESPVDSSRSVSDKVKKYLQKLVATRSQNHVENSELQPNRIEQLRNKVWRAIFPGQKFDIHLLSDAFSPAKRMLDFFLVASQILKEVNEEEFLLRLSKISIRKGDNSKAKKLLEELINRPIPEFCTESYLETRYNLLRVLFNFAVRARNLVEENTEVSYFNHLEKTLCHLFFLRKLRWECIALNQSSVFSSKKSSIDFSISVRKDAEETLLLENRILFGYSLVKQSFDEDETDDLTLNALFDILNDASFPRNSSEYRELFRYSVSFFLKVGRGKAESSKRWGKDLWKLYEIGMKNEFFLENGRLPSTHLMNLCLLGVHWTGKEHVIEMLDQYSPLVDMEGEKQKIYYYCKAVIHFHFNELTAANKVLKEFAPSGFQKLHLYVLSIKIQIGLSPDIVLSILDNFEKWLKKWNKPWLTDRVNSEKRRITLIRRMLRITPNRKADIEKLLIDIRNFEPDREWLEKKFTERFGSIEVKLSLQKEIRI